MAEIKLKPCTDCNGEIEICTNPLRGAFAKCTKCKKEFDICGMDKIPLYHGCRFRKSIADKIRRMWNRRSANENNQKGDKKDCEV